METLTTKAEEWRAKSREMAIEEAKPLQLPSGMTIMARRPGPALVAAHGRLPLSLAAMVGGDAQSGGGPSAEETISVAEFFRDLLAYCVVQPLISLHPAEGEIHPRDLPNEDVDFILSWAIRGKEAKSLETFRTERGDGSTGGSGKTVSMPSKRNAGHPGSNDSAELRSGGGARTATPKKRSRK